MAKSKSGISFEIVGLDEVRQAFENLSKEISDKVLLEINRNVARIAREELEKSVPVGNNDKKAANKIENNIIVSRGDRRNKTSVATGIRNKAFHARFLERGTGARFTRGKGKYKKKANRGSMAKRPFVSPAFERALPRMTSYFANNISKLMTRSLTRLQKRQAKKLGK